MEYKAGSHPGSLDTYGAAKLLTGQHSVDAATRPAGRADEQLDVGGPSAILLVSFSDALTTSQTARKSEGLIGKHLL